ncbi:MAG: EFR1 family ferrodoxin [Spirochaetales bacterium]|nr:EFR1 family ferrodoxin [Spirochaetales bacterium]
MTQSVSIFYFSGTGGTEMAARAVGEGLKRRHVMVSLIPLSVPLYPVPDEAKGTPGDETPQHAPKLLLFFPVYAMDAPWPVYEWIETLEGEGRRMGVISVSGGGEVWPNNQCREVCCRKLEEKGFNVVYEKMLIMPPNFITPAKADLSIWLLRALPEKADKTAAEFLDSRLSRIRGKMPSRFMRFISNMETVRGKGFGKLFKINQECTACGWCVKNCPTGNISLLPEKLKPVYGKNCALCMRCIYGCPTKAITSCMPVVFKEGLNLKKIIADFEGKQPEPLEKCARGIIWKGVKKYLQE